MKYRWLMDAIARHTTTDGQQILLHEGAEFEMANIEEDEYLKNCKDMGWIEEIPVPKKSKKEQD